MGFKKTIFYFGSLIFAQCVIAQDGATIKATVDKSKILIGEPIQLTIEEHLPPGFVLKFIEIDSIEHFELLEKPLADSTEKNGSVTRRAVYSITSFDSGHWVIPSFTFSRDLQTDSIPVDVVFSDFDPSQDYHDIKDILAVKPSKKKIAWWWYTAGMAILIVSIWWYLRQRKKATPVSAPKMLVSPYEEAMKQLEQLERDRPEAKQFHTRLTGIFRLYIFRKKGILSLQKTTDDLIVQLKKLELDKPQFDKLSQSLRLSDFVKFAKYLPSGDDNRSCFEEIRNAIMFIEKMEAKVLPPGGGRI